MPGTGATLILDQAFDGDSLSVLRAAVAAGAAEAGLPPRRVDDLVIAVHELAANAVRHGAGHGRLSIWKDDQMLRCQVTDEGAAGAGARDGAQWRAENAHGLWVVHQLADEISLRIGPHGTVAAIDFLREPMP
jgi:anti-sigma regulatory factor (Ser/Thr protein kinase)